MTIDEPRKGNIVMRDTQLVGEPLKASNPLVSKAPMRPAEHSAWPLESQFDSSEDSLIGIVHAF
jgi:hypothetical protein